MPVNPDLKTRIHRSYSQLRRSEKRVADYLGGIAGQRLDFSITDLARIIGVSEATISRVSRALGFEGYADLKLSMAAASRSEATFPNIPAALLWSDDLSQVSRKLASVLSASLAETEKLLASDVLERAVDAILTAQKVVFMGVGGAAAICQEAAHVFLKIGIDAVAYSDGYTQTIVASTIKAGTLLIAVSHTGATPSVVASAVTARRNGAETVGITGDATSALAQAVDLVFVTSQQGDRSIPLHGDFLEGRISQLYLIDVLYIGAMFRLGEAAKTNLGVTTQALAEHYAARLPHVLSKPSRRRKANRPSE